MKHEDVKIKIKSSVITGRHLEAFLMQSAYIESVFKLYIDINLKIAFNQTTTWTQINSSNEENIKQNIKNRIAKYGFEAMIDFMYDSKLVSKEEKVLFDQYRKKRNEVVHFLLEKISEPRFNEDLVEVIGLGNRIIRNRKFDFVTRVFDIKEGRLFFKKEPPSYFAFKEKRTKKLTLDKANIIVQMKLTGSTFSDIGTTLGLSSQRIRDLYDIGLNAFYGLSREKPNEVFDIKLPEDYTVDNMVKIVSEKFGFGREELFSKSRKKELVLPRHLIMYLIRNYVKPELSYPKIANLTFKDDHTTVMYACEKIGGLIQKGKIKLIP